MYKYFLFDSVVCQELPPLVNGRIEYVPDTTAPYLEGTEARHICNPGFVLIGNVTRVCQNDSSFDRTPPTCGGEYEAMHVDKPLLAFSRVATE